MTVRSAGCWQVRENVACIPEGRSGAREGFAEGACPWACSAAPSESPCSPGQGLPPRRVPGVRVCWAQGWGSEGGFKGQPNPAGLPACRPAVHPEGDCCNFSARDSAQGCSGNVESE